MLWLALLISSTACVICVIWLLDVSAFFMMPFARSAASLARAVLSLVFLDISLIEAESS